MGIIKNIKNYFKPDYQSIIEGALTNPFNSAFLWSGGISSGYDTKNKTYIEKGYNVNPMVYSIINQMSTKTASVPYEVKRIKDKQAKRKLQALHIATKGDYTPQQFARKLMLESKAFEEDFMEFPMEKPNANQSWKEFIALWKTFMKTTGNAYIYMLAPEMGQNKGQPIQVYLLPSHITEIVLKENPKMLGAENPIDYYIMIQGSSFIRFESENIIHTKYPNPNYGDNGEHLYGMSPLRAALQNIESSNLGLALNIKTLKSGGAFGLIHGKQTPLRKEQADALKERLQEMNASPEDLSKIAGVSVDVGFTRLSLTSEELKPFDYLNFDQKQIANVLQWDDKLLNSDAGAKYDNMSYAMKRAVTDNIIPDLDILAQALNTNFLPRFKGYEGTMIVFDASELPEMQVDMKQLVEWLSIAKKDGIITFNEFRVAINYAPSDNPNMDKFTVAADVLTVDEAVDPSFQIED